MLELHKLLAAYRAAPTGIAIPVLNEAAFQLGKYSDGSLLKFRGVVRDVQDPELVLLAPEGDVAAARLDAGAYVSEKLVERVPLKVTLFPHSTDWAKRAYDAPLKQESATTAEQATDNGNGKGTKRPSEAVENVEMEPNEGITTGHDDKKPKATPEIPADAEASAFLPRAVNIYVYDGQYKDTPLDAFKVNEAFEFVGILDLMVVGAGGKAKPSDGEDGEDGGETSLSARELEDLQISDCIDEVQRKDLSGVVLHCCDVSALHSVHHVRPHQPCEFYAGIHESNAARTQFCLGEWEKLGHDSDIAAMRKQLVDYLKQAVRGDTLAAEYLLLTLLSHVYARADPSTPLGNLSLNLELEKSLETEEKSAFVAQLNNTLESLMPMVARVDLSLKELNSTKFMPHKDYDREVLLGGVLQVANGTTMLVNETALAAGQLNAQGVKNIGALQSLVEKMLLPYDFQFYNMDFPQDVAVVTVSEGKSILPVNVAVPLAATDTVTEMTSTPAEQVLECFRVFLSVLRSFAVTIGNEEAEMAEKHYVECRKSQQKVALEDLHRWLRLARLVALSRGEGQVSKAAWQTMLDLETRRLTRSTSDASSA
ncbi:hypothetical protein BBJ28_00002754 [Nothophytophthora sp. Chile5]|nr:hypothetical protein BBJ28_00002754 [Nothophytophthora sp. Chile5]